MRFVILQHDWQGIHYDLMFEAGTVLRTWKLAQPPRPGQVQLATRSFDHRLIYLEYEGPVSGDRGQVTRWDAGIYEGEVDATPPIRLRLFGNRLKGMLELRHRHGEDWELLFTADKDEG